MTGPSENLVTSCPQCNSLVGLPSVMSLDATVRCPVCQHKYTLRSRLPQTIPQLQLVVENEESGSPVGAQGSAGPLVVDPTAKLEVNEILRRNAKLNRRRHHRRSSKEVERRQTPSSVRDEALPEESLDRESTAFQEGRNSSLNSRKSQASPSFSAFQAAGSHDDGSSEVSTLTELAEGPAELQTAGELADYQRQMASRTNSTRRRSSSSSKKAQQWVELAKVVFGALLALPVAQLIIWWVLAVDPLQLAPTVAKAVPFVVPAKVLEADSDE